VLLVLVGVQLVSTGLLGEMIGSTQASLKSAYVIREERAPRGPEGPVMAPLFAVNEERQATR
jgi:hypothetical protein